LILLQRGFNDKFNTGKVAEHSLAASAESTLFYHHQPTGYRYKNICCLDGDKLSQFDIRRKLGAEYTNL